MWALSLAKILHPAKVCNRSLDHMAAVPISAGNVK
jgi:hypothetical protein